MTRLASFCSGVLEVVNAVAVRLEDVVGEWVDGLAPRPATRATTERGLLWEWLRWYLHDSDIKSPPVGETVDILGPDAPLSSRGFRS